MKALCIEREGEVKENFLFIIWTQILTDCVLVPNHLCVFIVLLSWKVYFILDCSKCCWRCMSHSMVILCNILSFNFTAKE